MKRVLCSAFVLSTLLLHADTAENTILKESSWGINVNPFWLMVETFSGGISYFDHTNGVEYEVPLFIYNEIDDEYDDDYWNDSIKGVDFRYKRYNDGEIGGLYYGGFARYAYIKGKMNHAYQYAKQHKFGVGTLLGYRRMNFYEETPIYLGVHIGVGFYVNQENNVFGGANIPDEYDDRFFFELELFKIGLEF